MNVIRTIKTLKDKKNRRQVVFVPSSAGEEFGLTFKDCRKFLETLNKFSLGVSICVINSKKEIEIIHQNVL